VEELAATLRKEKKANEGRLLRERDGMDSCISGDGAESLLHAELLKERYLKFVLLSTLFTLVSLILGPFMRE
jgi:hypothetical protein